MTAKNAPLDIDGKKARSVRTRAETTAKKALASLIEDAQAALATIEHGGIPDASLAAHVRKYELAHGTLETIRALSGPAGPDEDDGTAVVLRDDLALLTGVVAQMTPPSAGDNPLTRLIQAATAPDRALPQAADSDQAPVNGQVPAAAP